jgi:hypothetical protein
MALPHLQEKFDALLDAVGLPRPFTLALFLGRLAAARGKPVQTAPFTVNNPNMPSGLWLALPNADVIFYEHATSPFHREHIVMHEIGHMLCGHTGRHEGLLPFLSRFLPAGCDPERLREAFALARTSYTTTQETEAEAFARHFGARVRRERGMATVVAPDVADAFARAMETLGPRS